MTLASNNRGVGSAQIAKRTGGRSARVRRAVFDATLAQLAANGYQSVTIDSVAGAAGVNKTTIYRNWPNKAALILAAAIDRSEALIKTENTGDPETDLVAFLTSVANNVTSPLGRALVIATLNASDDPGVRRAREEFWRQRFQAAGNLIRGAITDGKSSTDSEVDYFIESLIGPLFLRVFITGAPVDDTFIRDTVRHVLSHANQTQATR